MGLSRDLAMVRTTVAKSTVRNGGEYEKRAFKKTKSIECV